MNSWKSKLAIALLWGLAIQVGAIRIVRPDLAVAQTKQQLEAARKEMVELYVKGAGVKNERVLAAVLATPRHEFVPANIRERAYQDAGLPIGEKQTISSPFIVAYMTESIDPQSEDKVLEIGTGSGYQAAILSPYDLSGNRATATAGTAIAGGPPPSSSSSATATCICPGC